MSNFDSSPLIFDSTLFLDKNSPNIAKSNRVVPGKGGGNRALILTYLDSLMDEVFSPTAYIFRFRPSSGGNFWSKLVRLFSLILQFPSKQCFCLQEYYLYREFRQYWTIFGWVRALKRHKKGHLMDAESVRKTLKTFNLTISNAIMMKLTTIMYLHKRLNRKPLRTKNSILGVMSTNF